MVFLQRWVIEILRMLNINITDARTDCDDYVSPPHPHLQCWVLWGSLARLLTMCDISIIRRGGRKNAWPHDSITTRNNIEERGCGGINVIAAHHMFFS